jgi:hypothetical protein
MSARRDRMPSRQWSSCRARTACLQESLLTAALDREYVKGLTNRLESLERFGDGRRGGISAAIHAVSVAAVGSGPAGFMLECGSSGGE